MHEYFFQHSVKQEYLFEYHCVSWLKYKSINKMRESIKSNWPLAEDSHWSSVVFSLIFWLMLTSIDPDSCLVWCHWSQTLLLIDSGHPVQTRRPVSTLLLVCSHFILWVTLWHLNEAKATHERISECLIDWGINSYPDCHIQRAHCVSYSFPWKKLSSISN